MQGIIRNKQLRDSPFNKSFLRLYVMNLILNGLLLRKLLNLFKTILMKLIITTFFLIFNLTLFAQSNQFAGDYIRTLTAEENNVIEYKLTLHQDGTFLFHSYSKINGGMPPEVNKYGKGKWSAKDNLITFSTDKKQDLDEKYTLDFNNSIARFVAKNPRDKSDKVVKTRLAFVESKISWMQRIDIFKV